MNSVLIGLAGLMATMSPGPDFPGGAACEIRPDAPYINPRLPLGRAAYAQRPACRTTWAPGPGGPGLYVQGPPIEVDAVPVVQGGDVDWYVGVEADRVDGHGVPFSYGEWCGG